MSSFVDSKHQQLSQEEIIAIAAKETGGKYTAEQIKASLTVEAYEMKAIMIRQGNTIFIVHRSPERPDIAMFRALNADTIQNYLQNSVKFAKAIGMAGFKYMVTEFDDKSLLNIFKYIGRAKPFQNMGYSIQKATDKELYRVTVNLGDIEKQGGLPESEAQPADGAL
jgi:Zn-dependent M28 family amino/carboxypeptidase